MPENEFEKQIQSRLDSLNLEPSAAVWQQVEYRIRKDKRRRWFIWIPILAAGLGAGVWLVSDSGKSSLANHAAVETNAGEATTPIATPEKQSDQTSRNDPANAEENKLHQRLGENTNDTNPNGSRNRFWPINCRNKLMIILRQQDNIAENNLINSRSY
jgi:hypothetical protein